MYFPYPLHCFLHRLLRLHCCNKVIQMSLQLVLLTAILKLLSPRRILLLLQSNLEGSRLWKDQRGEGKRNENEQKLQSQRNKECLKAVG